MKIISSKYRNVNGTIFTYVLTQGAVNDVAAYTMGGACNIEDVARNGFKCTEKEALAIFSIPSGLHYRR